MPWIHPQETDMNRNDPHRPAACIPAIGALALALVACAGNQGTSSNRQAASPRAVTGHAGCFDPRMARGFAPVGDDVLLVDMGSNHYRVELDATCFGADFAPAMQFKGDPISGRVCGHFGDSVSWNHHECQIQRVDWITPEEHEALLHPAKAEDAPAAGQ
jgi:hypothetical protein